MKAPKFTIEQEDEKWYVVRDGIPLASCVAREKATALVRALKYPLEALESILSDAERYLHEPKKQTAALFGIKGSAKTTLLEQGYTDDT